MVALNAKTEETRKLAKQARENLGRSETRGTEFRPQETSQRLDSSKKVEENLERFTHRAYKTLEPSSFKSRYTSVANDRTFKSNLLKEVRQTVFSSLTPHDLEASYDLSSTDTLDETNDVLELNDSMFEVDAVRIVSDTAITTPNISASCLCDKFNSNLISKADDLVNKKGGSLMSLVTLTEKEINFIRTDTNQILSKIEDDPGHSFFHS